MVGSDEDPDLVRLKSDLRAAASPGQDEDSESDSRSERRDVDDKEQTRDNHAK